MPNATLAADVAKTERRWASEQALANASIEGHLPSQEYLSDCQAWVDGTMTNEEARARCLARALTADKAATERKLAGLQTKKAS